MEAEQRREQSFPAHSFEILLCDLRVETKLNDVPGSVFCRCFVNVDFLKIGNTLNLANSDTCRFPSQYFTSEICTHQAKRMELLRFIDNKEATNIRNKNCETLRVGMSSSVVFFFNQTHRATTRRVPVR